MVSIEPLRPLPFFKSSAEKNWGIGVGRDGGISSLLYL